MVSKKVSRYPMIKITYSTLTTEYQFPQWFQAFFTPFFRGIETTSKTLMISLNPVDAFGSKGLKPKKK